MSEMSTEVYEVTDGKITIQADAIRPGLSYRSVETGDGTVYLAENRRQENDGSRMVMLSGDVNRALQGFCNDMTSEFGHRLEYSVTISGLVAWTLHEDRWTESEQRVLEYGTALYRGEKKDSLGRARLMRISSDVMNRMNQFASHLSETTGGLNPERAVILNALLEWALRQEEAMEIVDDYNLELIQKRKEARQQARAQQGGVEVVNDEVSPMGSTEASEVQEVDDESSEIDNDGSDDSTVKGSTRRAKSAS